MRVACYAEQNVLKSMRNSDIRATDTLICLAMISEQLMAVIQSQMIQRIMTGMPSLGLAIQITVGMIMTVAIVVLI